MGRKCTVFGCGSSRDVRLFSVPEIRGSLGCNNNPNVTQFKTAYKKILLGASKKTANYIDTMTSLSLFDIEVSKPDKNVFIDEFEWVDLYFEGDDSNEFNDNVLSYISGYIQKRVLAKEKCEYCIEFLKNSSQTTSSFLEYVNEGGLIKPSEKIDFLVKKTSKILISFEKKVKLIAQKNVTERAVKMF